MQKLYDGHLAKAESRLRAGDLAGFENYMDRGMRFCPGMKMDSLRQRAASYRNLRKYVGLDRHNVAVVYLRITGAQAGKLAGKLTGSAEKKLKEIQ